MKHELPPLPYAYDALQPHISKETLEFHHDKHHKTYVDKLNDMIKGTPYENASLEEIIQKADGKVFNNAGQIWNHTFFWNCMSPNGGGKPSGELLQAIEKSFGSFDEFKSKFSQASADLFGSGWAWLTKKGDGSLVIEPLKDADTPVRRGEKAVLTLDVWEHAYYIDYRNKRPDFIAAFWNIVNWEFCSKNYGA